MPWSGSAPSQSFTRTDGTSTGDDTWQQAAAAPRPIEADDHDVHDTDLKDGINACLKKDGGNTASADLPMGGFKHTNVGEAAARTQYSRFSQIQDNKGEYVATVGGTADVITLTPSPAITAYVAGQRFTFIAGGDNTGAVTVNVSGVGAKDVKLNDGSATALAAGAIQGGSIVDIEYDGTNFLLLNVELGADLRALEALSTTGLARRTGAGTWATDGALGHLATTTADRLVGTDGSGVVGVATVTSPLAYSSSALSVGAASDTATGVIEIAVQSEMETGTSTTLAVTPGRQHFHPGHPKAWGRVASTGSLVSGDYNVASASKTGTGVYQITLSTAMADTNYLVVASAVTNSTPGNSSNVSWAVVSSSVFDVTTNRAFDGTAQDTDFGFAVFGDMS